MVAVIGKQCQRVTTSLEAVVHRKMGCHYSSREKRNPSTGYTPYMVFLKYRSHWCQGIRKIKVKVKR